jgi:NAD(P)-dependent dehydrogenase (short-subunit alcohol dehydrogenase family)
VSGPLTGRRALVTGGTRGIGLAIAERLRADDAQVLVTGSRPPTNGVEGVEQRGVDFADSAAVEAFAEEARDWAPDVLVNNAGINKLSPFAEIEPADWDRIQAVNVRAPMLLCRAVVPGMRERGWGRIVNIASIWSALSRPGRGSYSASKFALDGLTAALAAEVAADGILANCVSPGFVDTELTRTVLGEEGIARLVADVPAGRLAQPEEIAALVAWLAGPENTFVSAQNIVIDGGFSRS